MCKLLNDNIKLGLEYETESQDGNYRILFDKEGIVTLKATDTFHKGRWVFEHQGFHKFNRKVDHVHVNQHRTLAGAYFIMMEKNKLGFLH